MLAVAFVWTLFLSEKVLENKDLEFLVCIPHISIENVIQKFDCV